MGSAGEDGATGTQTAGKTRLRAVEVDPQLTGSWGRRVATFRD